MKLLLTSIASNVIERALPLLPKASGDCKVICIPTAANGEAGDKQWLHDELAGMRGAGLNLIMFELEGKTRMELESTFQNADIIYLTGGSTFYLLEKMRACDFEPVIRSFLARGGLYIGSSASTIACCPDIDFVREADSPEKTSLQDTSGLNLVAFPITVHMNQDSFAQKFATALYNFRQTSQPVICLNDDQALFIENSTIKII